MNNYLILEAAYLIASVLLVLSLKDLSSPETARRGMFFAEIGMAMAVVGTLFHFEIISYEWIIAGLVIGTLIGIPMGLWVPMTAMPQRIALSHAFGALAAALVGVSEFYRHGAELGSVKTLAIGFEVILGALTFTGSLVAAAKLHEMVKGSWSYKGKNIVTIFLFSSIFIMLGYLIIYPETTALFYIIMGFSFLFGIQLVMPIGAADMPVVISILNSYAGLSASATGFVLSNNVLIIAGALDGASGFLLSILMCKAMNRSAANVFFGGFGQSSNSAGSSNSKAGAERAAVAAASTNGQPAVKKILVNDVAMLLKDARKVVIVPGYGMAAAQAQHAVGELTALLKSNDIPVKFAIHPVAGRMPGHMNVLLAEAGIPYTDLIEMEDINPEFAETDVALVIGANDTTNPAARYDKNSPIYGMPILDVDKAKKVIICKRSMSPGFAGIDNDLYTAKNAWMFFGDAKATISGVIQAIKDPNLKGSAPQIVAEESTGDSPVKKLSADSAAELIKKSRNVIIVPGYGMAAAQAQHAVGELTELIKGRDISIKFAIHPVAGRMPGHMNVLLAEAGIPYTDLIEMEEINEEFPETDVALVIGANDTTNPAARYDKNSPIYGMPILNVDKAKTVIVCKRSMNPGFAGIDNDLYLLPNTYMLFGDAKKSIGEMVKKLKTPEPVNI